jgi:ubiquitin fusion degradation protein 1
MFQPFPEEEDEGLWAMDIDAAGFEETLRCRAASSHPDGTIRERLLYGGKMLLPQSCLETLSSLNVVYPLQFRVCASPGVGGRKSATHLGVLEFSASEGTAYLPDWALHTLGIKDRGLITITNISLPTGRFVKFQPTSVAFLTDLSDPRAVLEHTLRNYSCFSLGDVIVFRYLEREYGLRVEEVRPDDGRGAILAVETDLQVDFIPPPGYVEPSAYTASKSLASSLGKSPTISFSKSFSAFTGASNKLKSTNNNNINNNNESESEKAKPVKLPPGTLFFGSPAPSKKSSEEKEKGGVFERGTGRKLQ